MKKLIFFSLLACLALSLQAQVRIGFKAGLSSQDVKVEDLNVTSGGVNRLRLQLEDANYGINFGLVIRAEFDNFFVQPEANFNSNSVDFKLQDFGRPNSAVQAIRESYQYLDIPLMLGWRLGPLRIQGGPEGHLFVNSSSDLFDVGNYDQNFDNFTVGFIGGVGLDLWNLMVDLRYQGNFQRFGNHINFFGTQYQFSQRPSTLSLSAGWLFGRRR
jgi:Outer membrane protein beta-barrel domain